MTYNIYQNVRSIKVSKKYVKSIIEMTLKSVNKTKSELSVHFVGKKKIKTINNEYRHINKATDVIAFAMQEGRLLDKKDLGDIFISPEVVEGQAKKQSITYKEEFGRVLIHGILHLNGYDHVTKSEEKEMFGLQERLLKKILK